jgi:hypothetical protein
MGMHPTPFFFRLFNLIPNPDLTPLFFRRLQDFRRFLKEMAQYLALSEIAE